MCDPVTLGLLLTAGSGGASAVNQNQALRRQDRQAAEGIRRQGEISRRAGQRVDDQISDVAGATGEEQKDQALNGFLNVLRASRGATEGALNPVAAASPRFAERVSAGKADLTALGENRADLLSRIDGPLRLRQSEGDDFRRTAGDLGELRRQSSAEDFLTRLRVSEERPNEFIEALAGVGKGVGSVLTLGAGGPLAIGSGGANVTNPFISKVAGLA